jgi:hypothetical protein
MKVYINHAPKVYIKLKAYIKNSLVAKKRRFSQTRQ